MSDLVERISDTLDDAAEYLVMGEIASHTGLLVSQVPRNNEDYDIIVNNIDMSKSCMVEVIHSRDQFRGTIRSTDYDFLIFVYAPSRMVDGDIKPNTGKEAEERKGMYVFPRSVVKTAVDEATGTDFDPRKILVDGKPDKNRYRDYRGAFQLISELVFDSPPDFI
ncbi:hypothetical protein N9112_01805 [bacterium]|jgi:hypothetical protein|nr:hypothetical protein [bacterium]